jgi:hypothetical protein
VFVIVIILEAKLNGMFILICFGWLDLKLRYIWASVSFEKMSVIMLWSWEIRDYENLDCIWNSWTWYTKSVGKRTDTYGTAGTSTCNLKIMLLFVDIRIKTSKNGISILLLFMVKRMWSFKELSSVWKISTEIVFEIVEHGIQKALEKGPIHMELREQVHVTSNQNNIIPFVTSYNPRDYNIFHFMKQIGL